MIDLSKRSCVVFDHGQFVEFAIRLARDFGKVYYTTPWQSAFAKIDNAVVGDGFDEIERVAEIWDVIDKVDLAVFPDIHNSGMQRFIEERACPVWGARRADELEIKRAMFRALQKNLGLNIPEYDVVRGLEALRIYCQDPKHEDSWIKITPQYRGNRETFRHNCYLRTRYLLDEMGVEFGAMQDAVTFLVEKNIEAPFESGLDTYTVNGAYPSIALQGYEKKNEAYFGAVQPWEKIPKQLTAISERLSPVLKDYRCRQMISTEVKITESGEAYLLEPTTRFPSPAGESQLELYDNFSEIVYEGANGNLVDPVVQHGFCCQIIFEHEWPKDRWRPVAVPDAERRWIKLYGAACVKGRYAIQPHYQGIGSVVGVGNSPTEAVEHLKENCAALAGQPLVIHFDSIETLVAEIDKAQEEGLKFSSQPMPEPGVAVADD